jgi:hypothetical protein
VGILIHSICNTRGREKCQPNLTAITLLVMDDRCWVMFHVHDVITYCIDSY